VRSKNSLEKSPPVFTHLIKTAVIKTAVQGETYAIWSLHLSNSGIGRMLSA
jgi:hypothetical protein